MKLCDPDHNFLFFFKKYSIIKLFARAHSNWIVTLSSLSGISEISTKLAEIVSALSLTSVAIESEFSFVSAATAFSSYYDPWTSVSLNNI